jgi:DNA-binding MarR family transcriptional regulator
MVKQPATGTTLFDELEQGFRAMSTVTIMLHDTVARRLALNATDHKCLGLLCEHGSLSAREMAQLTGLTSGAVTGVINRLERAGYVERRPNPADARSIIITAINISGFLARMNELLGPLHERMRILVRQYPEEDLRQIARFMADAARISREETVRLAATGVLERRFEIIKPARENKR